MRPGLLCLAPLIVALTIPNSANAGTSGEKEHVLAEILSKPQNNSLHNLILALDKDGDFVACVRRSKHTESRYPAQDLIRGEVVLAKSAGRDAVVLSCTDCNRVSGGNLAIRYLTNGIVNAYRSMVLRLARGGDANWFLQTDKGEKVNNLTLQPRTILGRLIGIEAIAINAYMHSAIKTAP